MKLSTNFKEYMQGRAKLQHAMHVDPDDKVQNMLKQSMNHRFWANDYQSFKKGLLKDVDPAKVVLEGLKLRKKSGTTLLLENIEPDGTIKFRCAIKNNKVDFSNVPQELCDSAKDEYIDSCTLRVDYTAKLEYNSANIERMMFRFDKIEIELVVAGYDEVEDDSTEEEYHIWMTAPETTNNFEAWYVRQAPYYLSEISIDCHGTMDFSKWKVENATFGIDSDY